MLQQRRLEVKKIIGVFIGVILFVLFLPTFLFILFLNLILKVVQW